MIILMMVLKTDQKLEHCNSIVSNSQYDTCQRNLASFYEFNKKYYFNENCEGSCTITKINQELAGELHKIIIRKFQKPAAFSFFMDIICDFGLKSMQIVNRYSN